MKVCCVFNYNPHYRFPIYKSISEEFDCDFYFGDSVFTPIKQFDPNKLKGFKSYLKAKKTNFKGFIWHRGFSKIFSLKYTHYIITGDTAILLNWLIILFAKLTGRKVFAWTHGIKSNNIKIHTKLLLKAFFLPMDGILMYNEYNCKYMSILGCKKERLHIIHNSLDTEVQTEIYNTLKPNNIYSEHFGNSYPIIIFIGRVQKVKKTSMILEAMNILRAEGIISNLIVVGENVDDKDFDGKIKEYNLEENTWIYGPCFDERTNAELIYNANVCVSPGNVGLAAIHCLTYGTPVVTNDNFNEQMPEFEAIKEGVTGSFFAENNVQSLAEKIKPWLTLSQEERENTRKTARKEIEENWSVKSQIDLLKRVL